MNPDKYGYWQENKKEFRLILCGLFGHEPTEAELKAMIGRLSQEDRNKLHRLMVQFFRQSPKWSRKVACAPYL